MSASQTALVVIDVQESFRQRPYFDTASISPFFDKLQALVDGAAQMKLPVAQIFHVEDTGPFSVAEGHVRTMAPLSIKPDAIFHKRRHSALVGSGLDIWLIQQGISRLIISGIRTEQCCETTARHASDLGYAVDFVSEATLTFAMQDASGKRISAEDIKARTELVLADRFARIVTVHDALQAPSAAKAA